MGTDHTAVLALHNSRFSLVNTRTTPLGLASNCDRHSITGYGANAFL